jgi:hypothetical protein
MRAEVFASARSHLLPWRQSLRPNKFAAPIGAMIRFARKPNLLLFGE